jgi:Ran GTPase-activating protein (RanGAP) involved in mRNA processing and transport
MAIQPIDLQALFTQLDKVAKAQVVQREGQHIQQALQSLDSQRKLEENVQSVNESQELGEETEKIKDEQGRGAPGGAHANHGGGKSEEPESEEDEKPEMIRDPALGRNIDISG